MLYRWILSVILLSCSVLCSSGDSEQKQLLIKKLQSSSRKGVVVLTDSLVDKVLNGPRDYDVILLLTAEGLQFGCKFCLSFAPTFDLVASSWSEEHPDGDGLFFAIANVPDATGTFQRLQLTHAPNLFVYKRTNDSHANVESNYVVFKFPPQDNQLDPFLLNIQETFNKTVNIKHPFPWATVVFTSLAIIGGLVALVTTHSYIVAILSRKQLWIAFSLVAILMFTSGHMYNMIRKTPYVVSDNKGGVTYFVGGHSNQIAVETQIIAVASNIDAIMAFSTISLVTRVPKLSNPKSQLALNLALNATIFITFSFVISKFHIKNGSYPFHLLNIF